MKTLLKSLIISSAFVIPAGAALTLGLIFMPTDPVQDNGAIDRTLNFSKNKENILVLFTDETTGYSANKIVSDKYADKFDGFTAYDNVSTTGQVTNTTYHSLLAGPIANVYSKNYGSLKDLTLGEYADFTYGQMINMMHDAGYEQSYVAMQWFHEHDEYASDDQLLMNTFKDQDVKSTNHASLNDYRKTGVKHLVTERDFMNQAQDAESMYYLPELITSSDTNKPQFKFICSEQTHSSYWRYDSVQNKVLGGVNTAENNILSVDSQMGNYGRLFEKMQEEGVYDNSLIIVVSDHGAHPETAFDPHYLPASATPSDLRLVKMKQTFDWMINNPMLMVKKPNSNTPFQINTDHFMGNFDLPQIIANEIGSDAIKILNEGQRNFVEDPLNYTGDREIRKYGADWHFPEESTKFPNEMPIAINIKNNVWDVSSYSRGNIVLPGTSIEPTSDTYHPFR